MAGHWHNGHWHDWHWHDGHWIRERVTLFTAEDLVATLPVRLATEFQLVTAETIEHRGETSVEVIHPLVAGVALLADEAEIGLVMDHQLTAGLTLVVSLER